MGDFAIAHLRQGSVAVWEGEQVAEGQLLGEYGNSGSTSEPHTHIHHQRQDPREVPTEFAEGLPLYFRDHNGPLVPDSEFGIAGPIVQHAGE